MMKRLLIASLIFTAANVVPTAFTPALAAAAKNATCLTGTSQGNIPGKPFFVIVPANRANSFEARGMTQVPCNGKEQGPAVTAYRDKICELDRRAPQKVQQDFKKTFRFTPSELCNAASNITIE